MRFLKSKCWDVARDAPNSDLTLRRRCEFHRASCDRNIYPDGDAMPLVEDTFFLDPNFQGSLQSQIQQIVASAILAGRLQAGEKITIFA